MRRDVCAAWRRSCGGGRSLARAHGLRWLCLLLCACLSAASGSAVSLTLGYGSIKPFHGPHGVVNSLSQCHVGPEERHTAAAAAAAAAAAVLVLAWALCRLVVSVGRPCLVMTAVSAFSGIAAVAIAVLFDSPDATFDGAALWMYAVCGGPRCILVSIFVAAYPTGDVASASSYTNTEEVWCCNATAGTSLTKPALVPPRLTGGGGFNLEWCLQNYDLFVAIAALKRTGKDYSTIARVRRALLNDDKARSALIRDVHFSRVPLLLQDVKAALGEELCAMFNDKKLFRATYMRYWKNVSSNKDGRVTLCVVR